MTVKIDLPKLTNLVAKGIDVIFKKPSNIFWTGRVMDILFNGIEVDCTSNNVNSKAVCAVFETDQVRQVHLTNVENKMLFSIFSVVSCKIRKFIK